MVSRVGPLAMILCQPRQARKGAAVAADSCAGVWLAQLAALDLMQVFVAIIEVHPFDNASY